MSWLSEILAAPDRDDPRLRWADAIAGEDPDRAALVRIQCELSRIPLAERRRGELERAAWRLLEWTEREIDATGGARWTRGRLDAHRRVEWCGGLDRDVMSWRFERGMVGGIAAELPRLLGVGARVVEAAPVHALELYRIDEPSIVTLAAASLLDRIDELELVDAPLSPALLATLSRSPRAAGLRRLVLRRSRGLTAALPGLVPLAGRLRELVIDDPAEPVDRDAMAVALETSGVLVGLERLELEALPVDDDLLARALAAVDPGRLTALVIRRHRLGAGAVGSIARLERLIELDLGAPPWASQAGGLGDRGLEALAAVLPPSLVVLGLACQRAERAALAAVVGAAPPSLRELDLCGNRLDDDAAFGLGERQLRRLGLSGNRTGPERQISTEWDGGIAEETFDVDAAVALARRFGAEWVF